MRTKPLLLAVTLASFGCGDDVPKRQAPLLPTIVLPGTGGWPAPGDASGAQAGGGGASASWWGRGTRLPDVAFEIDVRVDPGEELLRCQYAQMPLDRGIVAVPAVESHYTPGSHHLLAYRTDLNNIPLGQDGDWECYSGGFLQHNRGSYYEAQEPDSYRELPPGIAHKFEPGEVVILQTHYVNASTEALDAHVALTLHTVNPAEVEQEAGSIIFSNTNISVPPHGKQRVTMTCKIPFDIHPAQLWSHMHKWGTRFVATTDDSEAAVALGDSLYTELSWNEPKPRTYPHDPPITIRAGKTITFSCDFENDTNNTLKYGDSAVTNEMCLLHGTYWPRMAMSAGERCQGGVTSRTPL